MSKKTLICKTVLEDIGHAGKILLQTIVKTILIVALSCGIGLLTIITGIKLIMILGWAYLEIMGANICSFKQVVLIIPYSTKTLNVYCTEYFFLYGMIVVCVLLLTKSACLLAVEAKRGIHIWIKHVKLRVLNEMNEMNKNDTPHTSPIPHDRD